MLNQVSIRSPAISNNILTLFDYSGLSSQTSILAPEMDMPLHEGYLREYCRYGVLKDAPSALMSKSYRAKEITARSFRDATIFERLGVVRHGEGPLVMETTGAIRHRFADWMDQLTSDEFRQLPISQMPGNYIYAAHGNYPVYAHVMFETICTAYLLKESLLSGRASLIVPDIKQTWCSQLLDLMQIPDSSRYQLTQTTRFENLIMSSACDSSSTFNPSIVMKSVANFLKLRAGVSREKICTERLYLTRRGYSNTSRRDYTEDQALSRVLSDLGFRTLNPGTMSIVEQIDIFSRAEIVIGAHSSAFANLIFSPPGCLVIDILPSHWANIGGMFTKNITNLFDQKYVYMIAESFESDGGHQCTLDPVHVYNAVREILN